MLAKVTVGDLFTWKAKIAKLILSVSYSFSIVFIFSCFGGERHGFILIFHFQASYPGAKDVAGRAILVFTRGWGAT